MVFFKNYPAPPWNRTEILRYAGVRGEAPETLPLLEDCLTESDGKLSYRVCWSIFPLRQLAASHLDLGFVCVESANLTTHLAGCSQVLVFAATVGIELDRLITRYTHLSPAKALMFQAIGAERIESLCDVFCRDITADQAETGKTLTRRFSPGYGDLPLSLQRQIFCVLDCPRHLGLTLNESLLMTPSKSVTALMGITTAGHPVPACQSGCAACQHESCTFRRNP